jgi:MYXO-CTERM domain-containing protein
VSSALFRRVRHAAGLLVLIAGATHRSGAQTINWDDYCTTGSFKACMSISVSLIDITPFVTQATVTLQNLEGSLGSGAWGLEGVALTHLAPANPIPGDLFVAPTPVFEGTAQDHGVPIGILAGSWLWFTSPTGVASIDRENQLGDGAYPIAGCSALTANPGFGSNRSQPGYFSTCGNGDIQYTFLIPLVSFTDQTSLSITGFADQSQQSFSCTFGVDCVQVTPEPSTFALAGVGLVVIGAVERRRRRRRILL